MWHPFALIPQHLELVSELRSARPSENRTVAFQERALTYFRDKSSMTEQWPVNMDELPGVKITRRGISDPEFEINHTWKLDYVRTLTGTMKCTGPWLSPLSWSFRRTFKPMFPSGVPFNPVEVEGRWSNGKLVQSHKGSKHKQVQTEPADDLISTYALMAGFPQNSELFGDSTALLGEDLVVTGSARLLRCPDTLQNHPLAEALTGYVLDVQGDFPTEFWVNEHGLVVYVFNGVSKVFILTGLEDAA